MTFAEITRYIKAREWQIGEERKEKAQFDYIQARLIGSAIGCCLDKNHTYPSLETAYPSLFTTEPNEDSTYQDQVSAARFKAFADNYNLRRGEK